MSDYVTRSELVAVERELRQGILETERILRKEWTTALHDFRDEMNGKLAGLDEHLTRQDALLVQQLTAKRDWRRTRQLAYKGTLLGGAVSFIVWATLNALHL